MFFDHRKLKGRIIECCGTQKNFAEKMKLSDRSISLKLNSKIDFTQHEIKKAIEILNIKSEEIDKYFFTIEVQNIEQSK